MLKENITRRDALKLLGAGSAGTVATSLAPSQVIRGKDTEEIRDTDIVVVGAVAYSGPS